MSTLKAGKPSLVSKATETPKTETDGMNKFNPRHTSDRNLDVSRTLEHFRDLRDIFPNTGLAHLWNIPDHFPDACNEMEVTTIPDPLFVKMENMLCTNASKENLPCVDISEELVNFIEKHTKDQRLFKIWQELHIGRLTSSIFGDVLSTGDNPRSDNYNRLPPAVQGDTECQSKAKEEYIQLQSMINPNLKVEDTGLTFCASHSFLGASSDGKIIEDDRSGLLEIKCPYIVKGMKLNKMEVLDIVDLNYPDVCLQCCEEGVRLKSKHKYYAQIQGEMAVMSLPSCDFVVWTAALENNIFVERIHFGAEFVSTTMPKLVEFYMKHIFPVFLPVIWFMSLPQRKSRKARHMRTKYEG